MSTRQGEVSLRVGYTFFVKETMRMLVDIPGTLSPFQNASLTVVGGDSAERLTLYLNKTQLTLVLVCQRAFSLSRCQKNVYPTLKETSPCLVDLAQGAWYVNATSLCLFDKKCIISRTNGLSIKRYWYQVSVSVTP